MTASSFAAMPQRQGLQNLGLNIVISPICHA